MRRVAYAALLLPTVAFAQAPAPQPNNDPAFLQRAIGAVQQQRNQALDGQAVAEAQRAQLAEELSKVRGELDALKPKPAQPAPPPN